MLKIKKECVNVNGHWFDYELENGVLLHANEWNGEDYTVIKDGKEVVYKPIYADKPNVNDGFDVIGFEESR